MRRLTEDELAAARANVEFAEAMAACGWDWTRLPAAGVRLGQVTEICVPKDFRRPAGFAQRYANTPRSAQPFRKMYSLKRIRVECEYRLPIQYFAGVTNVDEVEIPFSAMNMNLFDQNAAIGRLVVSGKAEEVAEDMFSGMRVRSVFFRPGVDRVPCRMFSKCAELESVSFPQSLSEIDGLAFNGCKSLKEVSIPDGCALGGFSFCGCKSLEKAVLPYGIDVPQSAFKDCGSLQYVYVNGDIRDGAFEESGLREVQIGPGAKSVGERAFKNCGSLESVQFGPNVEFIGKRAFMECRSLKSLSLPPNAKVGAEAFCDSGLKSVVLKNPDAGAYDKDALCAARSLQAVYLDFPAGGELDGASPGQFVRALNRKWRDDAAFGDINVFVMGQDILPDVCAMLIDAGVDAAVDGRSVLAEFGENGITPEKADSVSAILSEIDGCQVTFNGKDGEPIEELSDLSQIKSATLRFGETE